MTSRRSAVLGLALAAVFVSGCSLTGGTLGGRSKCWPESDPRMASLFRGTLVIDESGGRLDTPEGDVIPLRAGTLRVSVAADGTGQLVRGTETVAKAGDDVTLFGGAGSDGTLVVCDVEEIH
jgi:hypothetical protein